MVDSESAMMLLSSLTASVTLSNWSASPGREYELRGTTYINWLGFFFFLRMAVAVSSSWSGG